MKQKKKGFIIALWAANVLLIILVGIGFVIRWETTPFAEAQGIPTLMVLASLPPSVTTSPTTTGVLPTSAAKVFPPTISVTVTSTIKPSITPYIHITDTPTSQPWMEGPRIIGYSVNAKPLEVYRFGTGSTVRMIVAGIHGGGEWNTIALADEIIAYLSEHPDSVPENITLYVLRNLNPDGEARAHGPEGRVNDHGVDLNRNYPNNWQAEWDRDGCWTLLPTTAGEYAGSEPETVALMIFLQQRKVEALISYHSAALGIFAGGVPPDKESIDLAKTLADVSTYPYPPVDTGCQYTGALVDWASSKGIAAVDIELTNHTDTDLIMNLDILKAFLSWKR